MKPEKNNRIHQHSIRFTEEEEILLKQRMDAAGYHSRARYVRDKVLGREIYVPRNVRVTDRGLRDQLNAINAEIQKIGVNYNQTVRVINTAAKRPNVNQSVLEKKLEKLFKLTSKLPELLQVAIDVIKSAEQKVALRDTNPQN